MWRAWYAAACVLLVGVLGCVEGLGVNWGTIATHQLPPKVVVQMLKDNGIQKVKLFDVDAAILKALAGSGIEVMVTIANSDLAAMNNFDRATAWVKQNVTAYVSKGGVNITYVAVGNEPFLKDYKSTLVNVTFPALKNIQTALNEAGLGDSIKATVPFNADVYESPSYNPVPSAGRFRGDVSKEMAQIVQFLNQSKSAFVVNIYPFLSLFYGKGAFPLDFAFFDGVSNPLYDNGNGKVYSNVFDANFDTLVAALQSVGSAELPIMVGEMGWPTDGDQNANVKLASRFYNGLFKKLAAKKGTPVRPGYNIEVYIFGLFDEDAKSILPGNFERHWGILRYDGQAKYPIDLSGTGKGKGKAFVPAQNVEYLPKKWCVLNPNGPKNSTLLEENLKYACDYADCTPIEYGSSCNGLEDNEKASYVFNAYFQNQNQVNGSCDFAGQAVVTTKDISQGACNFTIQLSLPKPVASPAPSPVDSQGSSPGAKHSPGHSSGSSLVVASAGTSLVALAFLTLLSLLF